MHRKTEYPEFFIFQKFPHVFLKDLPPRCILYLRMTVRMADIDDLIRQMAGSERLRLDPRICESMMLTYYDFVDRLTRSFLGDSDEAEDATQETFLQASLHLDQYQGGTSLKSWLAKIAINVCRGRYRRQKARQRLEGVLKVLSLQMHTTAPTPEDTLIQHERQHLLKKAVDSLDEKHRMPVLLRYVHGLSVPEIALALDLNEGTVYSRLHYAHAKLRKDLGQSAEYLEGRP